MMTLDDTDRQRDRPPSVTVVLPVTDEALARLTLGALERQVAPPGGWCVEVELRGRAPGLERLVNGWIVDDPDGRRAVSPSDADGHVLPRAALDRANTEVVVFLFEGAVMSPSWVVQHAETFERAEVGAGRGSIELHWMVERPRWWTSRHDAWLGAVDAGDRADSISGEPTVAHNVSVRRGAFDRPGPLPLGAIDLRGDADRPISGLRARGWHAVNLPDATLVRTVRADSIERSTLRRLAWERGQRTTLPPLGSLADHVAESIGELRSASTTYAGARGLDASDRQAAALDTWFHLARAAAAVGVVDRRGRGLG